MYEHISSFQSLGRAFFPLRNDACFPYKEKRVQNKCTPVRVAVLEGGGSVICGAFLSAEEGWLPSSQILIGDKSYLSISKRDRRFAQFCGKQSVTFSSFLDALQEARNLATDKWIEEYVEEHGPTSKRLIPVPKAIPVRAPYVTGLDTIMLDVASARVKNEKVAVAITPDALKYIAQAVSQDHTQSEKSWKKRPLEDVVYTPLDICKWNYARSCVYIWYHGEDGRRRRKCAKRRDGSDTAGIAKDCSELAEFYQENHIAPAGVESLEDGEEREDDAELDDAELDEVGEELNNAEVDEAGEDAI